MTTSVSAADQAGSASTSASPARRMTRLCFLPFLSFCFFLAIVGAPQLRRFKLPNQRDIIQQTAEYVRGLLSAEGSHDWFHIERVRHTAMTIGREERADL